MGAPGSFPVEEENRKLQKYMTWSTAIETKADDFIKNTLPQGPFVGIHLRNGIDFVRSCITLISLSLSLSASVCVHAYCLTGALKV